MPTFTSYLCRKYLSGKSQDGKGKFIVILGARCGGGELRRWSFIDDVNFGGYEMQT